MCPKERGDVRKCLVLSTTTQRYSVYCHGREEQPEVLTYIDYYIRDYKMFTPLFKSWPSVVFTVLRLPIIHQDKIYKIKQETTQTKTKTCYFNWLYVKLTILKKC